MIFVSDVHGALEPLRRLAIADALGLEFAQTAAEARASGDYAEMRALWAERVGDRSDEVRQSIGDSLTRQYDQVAEALEGGHGFVIHGNVDRPDVLSGSLPEEFRYVHGEVVEIEGLSIGFAGGGVATPIQAAGEVSDMEMTGILEELGDVDVLCTHVAPAVQSLRTDVITGRQERGSEPVRDFVLKRGPRFHLFGDVHQAQATAWRLGKTHCHNAGYFRATGRCLQLDEGGVKPVRVC